MSGETPRDVAYLAAQARRIVSAAADQGAVVRLTGGVGVRERVRDLGGLDPDSRPYHDLDLVARLRDVRAVDAVFASLGYAPDRAVNTQFGTVRRVYYHPDGHHADVFLDRLDFCHRIELLGRLELHALTLAPADLLLGKLQIVERNRKDLVDAVLLLLNHDLIPGEPTGIELDRILALTSDDWGLFTTASDFLEALRASLPGLGFSTQAAATADGRAGQLAAAIAASPKSLKWRARERVGRRVRWYRVVEEVM